MDTFKKCEICKKEEKAIVWYVWIIFLFFVMNYYEKETNNMLF